MSAQAEVIERRFEAGPQGITVIERPHNPLPRKADIVVPSIDIAESPEKPPPFSMGNIINLGNAELRDGTKQTLSHPIVARALVDVAATSYWRVPHLALVADIADELHGRGVLDAAGVRFRSREEFEEYKLALGVHDAGTSRPGLSDDVLNPLHFGNLKNDQVNWPIHQMHPTIGAVKLRELGLSNYVLEVVGWHHGFGVRPEDRYGINPFRDEADPNELPDVLQLRFAAVLDAGQSAPDERRLYQPTLSESETGNMLVAVHGDYFPHNVLREVARAGAKRGNYEMRATDEMVEFAHLVRTQRGWWDEPELMEERFLQLIK